MKNYVTTNLILDDQGGQQISVRTDGKSPTLRAEMHGNQPCVLTVVGVDMYNQSTTGKVSRTLKCPKGGDDIPCIAYGVTTKGNGDAFVSEERHTALTNGGGQAGQGYPCVLTAVGVDRYNQATTGNVMPTLKTPNGGDDIPCVVCYSFDSMASNSMKSKNPHSGCRAVEVAKCLDTSDTNPSKNQGGIAVVQRKEK